MKHLIIIIVVAVFSINNALSQNTNNKVLGDILEEVADTLVGQEGRWQFAIKKRVMLCITDETNNRMRIMSPVTEVSNLDEEQFKNALTANFHTALDVKYAISDETLWTVFIHPLLELTPEQFRDAISQVYVASETFGTLYSSTELIFGGGFEEPQPKEKPDLELKRG